MAQVNAGNRLPKKEAEQFRTLVTLYETKQYKKGLKAADAILKKFPNHGETQAMKGIIMNGLNNKTEAYELVKSGLRNDVRSHICWHVYGLLYRSDGNYKEAIKCYLNALRIDPNNQNILRDLSWLQAQMRDRVGFAATRRKILEGKPALRNSWVAFAVANYMLKEYGVAFEVVSKYYDSVTEQADPFEESEFLLFQNLCLERQGKHEEALQHLSEKKPLIVDKLAVEIKRAQLLCLANRHSEARMEWERLVWSQTENYSLHKGLQIALLELDDDNFKRELFALKKLELPCSAVSLSKEKREALLAWYQAEVEEGCKLAESRTSQLIQLLLLLPPQDSEGLLSSMFQEKFKQLVMKSLEVGLPSLHHDVCSLVLEPSCVNGAQATSQTSAVSDQCCLLQRLRPVLSSFQFRKHPVVVFALDLVASLLSQPPSQTSPQTHLWALYLKTHLLERSHDLSAAMQTIDQALEHTPTALDCLTRKARLFKKGGRWREAAQLMDEARALDLQDRYLNNKAAKYLLRANEVEQAVQTIAMFTKHEGDVAKTLQDLQVSWFEMESAEAFQRLRRWGPSLKHFYSVKKHFVEQYDDLFDFHGYCVRKSTLRAYLDAMAVQDHSFGHTIFQRAFRGAVKVLLHLLDCPEDADGLGHLTPAERKKERMKLKKKKQKEEKEKVNEKEGEETSSNVAVDDDPYGEKLLSRDFNAEVSNWCNHLAPHLVHCNVETLVVYADACLRRGKYLPVVRALHFLKRQHSRDTSDLSLPFEALLLLAKLSHKLKGNRKVTGQAASVARELLGGIIGERGLNEFLQGFLRTAQVEFSLPHMVAALSALHVIDKSTGIEKMRELLGKVTEGHWKEHETTIDQATTIMTYFLANFPDETFTMSTLHAMRIKFPFCPTFQPFAAQDEADELEKESDVDSFQPQSSNTSTR